MTDQNDNDWIDHYGFILVAFAHMTDWYLADSELQVISDKINFMLANTKQSYNSEGVAQKIVKVINRYKSISEDSDKMDALFSSCASLKKEPWFNKLASVLLLENLAEIAEADHKIEETEIQFLKNIADVFGINPPKI
ncbi:MAG: TerB family tellurite resistance protein [Candidatus Marinimicrobia bacterium]|nr:TerB family tellurite resistance protein [Candidatus Neomarinimicrobiota bacterium]